MLSSGLMRALAWAVAALGLLLRIALAWQTPAYQAPDEEAHVRYVRYLAERHAFPVQTSHVNAPTHDWEYYQPPLYYLLLAPIHAAARGGGELMALRVLRLCSVLLWALQLALVWRALRVLGVRDPMVVTTATAVSALLPTYVFISAMVNNDNLLIVLSTAVLAATAADRDGRGVAWIGVLLGLALLTKLSAVVLVVAVAASFALQAAGGVLPPRRALRNVAVVLAIAALIAMPWAIRMLHVYGDLTAERVANVPVSWPSARAGLLHCIQYLGATFWAVGGIYNDLSYRARIGTALTALGGVGLVVGLFRWLRGWGRAADPESVRRAAHIAGFAVALAVNLAMTLRFGFLYGWAQGRFVFPMLLPIGLLVGLAWRALVPAALVRPAAAVVAAGFAAYALGFTRFVLAAWARV